MRLLLLVVVLGVNVAVQAQEFVLPILQAKHQQVILVTSPSWASATGKLALLERVKGVWVQQGEVMPVALGKYGLAWGRGVYKPVDGIQKKEGDKKAPAGIFTLGTSFGYVSSEMITYPFKKTTSRDYFVDDVNSNDYNTWQHVPNEKENTPKAYWGSYERLRRNDHLYEFGLVVNHNTISIKKGAGSAIFLHVWRSVNSPTLGCTSSSKENIISILRWLDSSKEPLLIQVPEGELEKLEFHL